MSSIHLLLSYLCLILLSYTVSTQAEPSEDIQGDFIEWNNNNQSQDRNQESSPVSHSKPSVIFAMNSTEAPCIASKDGNMYQKYQKDGWQTIRAQNPAKVGFFTEIEVKVVRGLHRHDMHFGFAIDTGYKLQTNWLGHFGYSYGTGWGSRCMKTGSISYADTSAAGDLIKLKLDMREGHQTLEYFKNGVQLGLFFSGLDLNTPLYFAASLNKINDAFEIISFVEYKQ